jgi:hypothetical protein
MQARRSGDEGHRRSDSWSLRSGKFANGARKVSNGNEDLIHNYDIESNSHNLAGLTEDSDEEESPSNTKRTSFDDGNGRRTGGSNSRNPSGTKANGGRR